MLDLSRILLASLLLASLLGVASWRRFLASLLGVASFGSAHTQKLASQIIASFPVT